MRIPPAYLVVVSDVENDQNCFGTRLNIDSKINSMSDDDDEDVASTADLLMKMLQTKVATSQLLALEMVPYFFLQITLYRKCSIFFSPTYYIKDTTNQLLALLKMFLDFFPSIFKSVSGKKNHKSSFGARTFSKYFGSSKHLQQQNPKKILDHKKC